jgi:hypothetical protein
MFSIRAPIADHGIGKLRQSKSQSAMAWLSP